MRQEKESTGNNRESCYDDLSRPTLSRFDRAMGTEFTRRAKERKKKCRACACIYVIHGFDVIIFTCITKIFCAYMMLMI